MIENGPFGFEETQADTQTSARCGVVSTKHGKFLTPAFMPVGTQACVKGLLPEQVDDSGAEIILANTYHLHLRPGEATVAEIGGLHKFMNWQGPILTDSGGFQVWSLSDLRKIDDDGVSFKSHIDGSSKRLDPKIAMQIQKDLGSDIIMSFDECMDYPIEKKDAEISLERTHRWEKETLAYHPHDGRALFAIIQGGVFPDLRKRSAEFLLDLPFDGYAMGGLFIGEIRDDSMAMLEIVGRMIPAQYPRYVMGVGTPLEILDCVARGWDMFDCVLPTRNGRHGTAMTATGRKNLKNARFKNDPKPIEEHCNCLACKSYSRAYIRHLITAGEVLGMTLVSHHNLSYMQRLMKGARQAIAESRFQSYRDSVAEFWTRPSTQS
ncbi:MAG: queuine tRNA-ribosyltransferase [Planctomycetota bacterium]|jgi:queuine tRNA-ribosyltransferase